MTKPKTQEELAREYFLKYGHETPLSIDDWDIFVCDIFSHARKQWEKEKAEMVEDMRMFCNTLYDRSHSQSFSSQAVYKCAEKYGFKVRSYSVGIEEIKDRWGLK